MTEALRASLFVPFSAEGMVRMVRSADSSRVDRRFLSRRLFSVRDMICRDQASIRASGGCLGTERR